MNRAPHRRKNFFTLTLIIVVACGVVGGTLFELQASQHTKSPAQPSTSQPAPQEDAALACVEKLDTKTLIGQKLW